MLIVDLLLVYAELAAPPVFPTLIPLREAASARLLRATGFSAPGESACRDDDVRWPGLPRLENRQQGGHLDQDCPGFRRGHRKGLEPAVFLIGNTNIYLISSGESGVLVESLVLRGAEGREPLGWLKPA